MERRYQSHGLKNGAYCKGSRNAVSLFRHARSLQLRNGNCIYFSMIVDGIIVSLNHQTITFFMPTLHDSGFARQDNQMTRDLNRNSSTNKISDRSLTYVIDVDYELFADS